MIAASFPSRCLSASQAGFAATVFEVADSDTLALATETRTPYSAIALELAPHDLPVAEQPADNVCTLPYVPREWIRTIQHPAPYSPRCAAVEAAQDYDRREGICCFISSRATPREHRTCTRVSTDRLSRS